MREIKFRGKFKSDGLWEFGSLWIDKGKCYINGTDNNWWKVIPDTVGQYTGLKDKNGVEIYEVDMVKLIDSKNKILECTVEYITGSFWYVIQHNQLTIGVWEYHNFINKSVEVIGNIYESKELLEGMK